MLRALLVITVERRVDPAATPLIAFGGAGGLHAASLMLRLGMPFACIPDHPGALSAVGLAHAEETVEVVEPIPPTMSGSKRSRAEAIRRVSRRAIASLRVPDRRAQVEVQVRLRFAGQGLGLWIRAARGAATTRLESDFVALHEERFGFAPTDRTIEWVEVRARASLRSRRPDPVATGGGPTAARRAEDSQRRGARRGEVLRRADLRGVVSGPICIEEPTSVTVVPAGCQASLQPYGIRLEKASA